MAACIAVCRLSASLPPTLHIPCHTQSTSHRNRTTRSTTHHHLEGVRIQADACSLGLLLQYTPCCCSPCRNPCLCHKAPSQSAPPAQRPPPPSSRRGGEGGARCVCAFPFTSFAPSQCPACCPHISHLAPFVVLSLPSLVSSCCQRPAQYLGSGLRGEGGARAGERRQNKGGCARAGALVAERVAYPRSS